MLASSRLGSSNTRYRAFMLLALNPCFIRRSFVSSFIVTPTVSLGSTSMSTTRRNFATSSDRPIAERVLDDPKWPESWPYDDKVDFAVMDASSDEIFYDQPRLVYHIDDAAVEALTAQYKTLLNEGDDVLDICSSWVSHYPVDWKGGENVIGLGMNKEELERNPVLTDYVVKNLNADPVLPFPDNSFDKITCVVSIDYLTQPKQVVTEMGRCLRPGGEAIISISNRCFPTKAMQIWLQTSDMEHVFIVGSFFHFADGLFEKPSCIDASPNPGRSDPLYIVRAKKKKV